MNQQKTGLTEINETSSKMCSNLEVLLFCIHVPFVVKKNSTLAKLYVFVFSFFLSD